MVEEKFILVSLEDERAKHLADVLGNKTCKKIIEHLAEAKEASEKDLSVALKVPLNTVEYNLKKLIESGFVEKRKNFFWSKRGKKILMYQLTNKSIIISPKGLIGEKFKSILPSVILLFAGAVGIFAYEKIALASQNYTTMPTSTTNLMVAQGVQKTAEYVTSSPPEFWLWFLAGGILALLIFAIVNWRRL